MNTQINIIISIKLLVSVSIIYSSILFSQELTRFHEVFSENSHLNSDSARSHIHISLNTLSNIFSPSDRFYDKRNFLISFSKKHNLNKHLSVHFSPFIENVRYKSSNNNIKYWKYDFSSISGGVSHAYFDYHGNNIDFKFGRDYFLYGYPSSDKLLFSSYTYPYDQFRISLKNKNITLESFYLSLNRHPNNSDSTRHINGHRLEYSYENGYINITELALYGGYQEPINLSLFNPLLVFYLYQDYYKFDSNIIYSIEWLHKYKKTDIFIEFILDDIQIDKKIPADLEPPEFGFLFELKTKLNSKLALKYNYLKVSNRTFNAPFHLYEKMINNTIPIGHPLGNNFWKSSLGISCQQDKKSFNLEFVYIQKGDEALYSEFDKSYLDYTVEQGYFEKFPFGTVKVMSGIIFDYEYLLNNYITISPSISYWENSYLDNLKFNYSLTLIYDYYK